MSIYHLSVKIIGKSGGKSAVAAAAYRSGSQLLDQTRNITHNYTQKSDVDFCEVLLPENAPKEFSDRETLWNNVEQTEKKANAQLAREIEFALPTELSFDEQKKLAHNFALSFVKEGMCVDLAFHNKNGNPHCHLMLTMRSIDKNGKWLPKCKSGYSLDENGEKIPILGKDGQQLKENGRRKWKKFTVTTNDWNNPEKVEEWRSRWSDMANMALEKSGVSDRIDHRSFERQGIELLPTIHLGQAAHALEKKGIRTAKGDVNRARITQNREIVEEKIGKMLQNLSRKHVSDSGRGTVGSLLVSVLPQIGTEASGGKLSGFLKTDISELVERLMKAGKSEQEIEEVLEDIESEGKSLVSGIPFSQLQEFPKVSDDDDDDDGEEKTPGNSSDNSQEQQMLIAIEEQKRLEREEIDRIRAGIARRKRDIERRKREFEQQEQAINITTSTASDKIDGIREPKPSYGTIDSENLRATSRDYVAELLAFRAEEAERELARISKEREETERRERELANKPKSTESGTGTIERATPADESTHSSPRGTKTASITTGEPVHIRPRGITRTTEQTTAKNQRGFSR